MGKVTPSAIHGRERHHEVKADKFQRKCLSLARLLRLLLTANCMGSAAPPEPAADTSVYSRSSEMSMLQEIKMRRGNFIRCPQL